jgi:hypothetical protein
MSSFNKQIGCDHYRKLKIQPSDYILKNNLGWCEGNVIKYLTRWPFKGKNEAEKLRDLLKAKHYLEMIIETQETKVEKSTTDPNPWIIGLEDSTHEN